MRTRRRKRETFKEHSYWQSYSDMMAALLLLFVLITAITLAVYKQKTTDLENTKDQLLLTRQEMDLVMQELEESNRDLTASLEQLKQAYDREEMTKEELERAYEEIRKAREELNLTKEELESLVGVRMDIIESLQDIFNTSEMKVDMLSGSITFSSDVLFRYNSSTLSEKSKDILKEVIPMYLSVLLQEEYRDYIAEIIIEGHTDTVGTYEGNMELSYNRAKAVALYCLREENGLTEEQIERLKGVLTVNGRSYSSPVYLAGSSEIDMAASRRVEIKFRLKEEEMINKISEIISVE